MHPKHPKLGEYFLVYSQDPGDNNIKSKLSFKVHPDSNECFLITQTKPGKIQKFYPMTLKSNEEGNFKFECQIPKEEFPKNTNEKIYMDIDVMMFKFEN